MGSKLVERLKAEIKEAQDEYDNTHDATGKMSEYGRDDPENAGFDEGWLKALEFVLEQIEG